LLHCHEFEPKIESGSGLIQIPTVFLSRHRGTGQYRSVATPWEYRPDPMIWAPLFGSVRRLPNGHSVVAFGAPPGQLGATGPLVLHEVSPSGQRLWSLLVNAPGGGIFQADPITSVAGEVVSTTE